jgi:hypothetical protein
MKRFFKILKWSLLGLLAVAGAFLVVSGIRAAWAGHRLNEKLAALRAADQPLSLVDLVGEPISPEHNAETYLHDAQADVEAINAEVYAAYRASPKADQEAADELRPTPAYLAAMRAALAAFPKAYPLLEQASNCPDYDPPFDFHVDAQTFTANLLPAIQDWRSIARLTEYRVLVQLDEGHPEDALQTCLTMFRLVRLFDRNPTLISHLVGIAIRGMAVADTNLVLRSGPLPPAAHAALEQELARHDMIEQYRHAMRTERAFGLQSFQDMTALMGLGPTLLPWLKNDECIYLDLMDHLIKGVAIPFSKSHSGVEAVMPAEQDAPLTWLILPATQQVHAATFRTIAQFRMLRVLNALTASEQAGGGEPTLADLGLPADVVTDPFNGEPLHLAKLPGGWLVYSVGMNLKDDGGGDLTDFADVGFGPSAPANTDGDTQNGEKKSPAS